MGKIRFKWLRKKMEISERKGRFQRNSLNGMWKNDLFWLLGDKLDLITGEKHFEMLTFESYLFPNFGENS